MATLPPPLSLIPADAVDVNFPPPQYEADFAQIVGNAVTDSDGWAALIQPLSDFVGTLPDFLTSLDFSLAAIDSVFSSVSQVWEQPFADTITSAISQGQPTFDKYATALTQTNPPAPGSPPAAGSGSSTGPGTYSAAFLIAFKFSNGTTGVPPSASPQVLCLQAEVT